MGNLKGVYMYLSAPSQKHIEGRPNGSTQAPFSHCASVAHHQQHPTIVSRRNRNQQPKNRAPYLLNIFLKKYLVRGQPTNLYADGSRQMDIHQRQTRTVGAVFSCGQRQERIGKFGLVILMTVSTEIATPPKSVTSTNPDSTVFRGTNSN